MVLVVNVHLELLQHYTPVGKDWDHSNNDIGAAQTCLKIDDFEAAHSEPVSRGAGSGLQGSPGHTDRGRDRRLTVPRLRDPAGIQRELSQTPST